MVNKQPYRIKTISEYHKNDGFAQAGTSFD